MSTVEQARRADLQKRRGVGGSRGAVMARRARERMNSVRAVEEGERLPWWVDVPEVATPENIQAYLDSLDKSVRLKAEELLKKHRGV